MVTTDAPRDDAPTLAIASAPELVLRWLVPLRFLAAAGGAAALLVARYGLGLALPYRALWWVPALTLLSNLAVRGAARRGRPRAARLVPGVLLFDSLLFTFLLEQSGGPDNPLSALYAIPVAMAAMTGSAGATWCVAAVSAAGYALVFRWHETQHFWHAPVAPGSSVGLHAVGMWIAVVVVSVVITFFVGRITRTLREREEEIHRLGGLAARTARLASLTTLAAGAAHELGSPLGTIAVVAREIERHAAAQGPASLGEDARLLRDEVDRCRSILDRMLAQAERSREDGAPLRAEQVPGALRDALGADAAARIEAELRAPAGAGLGSRFDFVEMVVPLLRNALDAAPGAPVELLAELSGDRLSVRVRDRGEGMDAGTLARAGEPFFTTRAPGRGTGLGLFVVRLNAERLGGTLQLSSSPGAGTTAVVEWPIPEAGGARGA